MKNEKCKIQNEKWWIAIQFAFFIFHFSLCISLNADEPVRAKPPEWSRDVLDLFFPDARKVLQGDRPNYAALKANRESAAPIAGSSDASPVVAGSGWNDIVDPETLETEIKRLAKQVATDVTTPGPFKGGGYKVCRGHFSTLAVIFAVIAEYDERVRWRDAAPGLRDLFARAGSNCKTGTDQTFREASLRKQDITDLVRGSRPQVPKGTPDVDWPRITDRPPLMERMEVSHGERLTKWLASGNEFRRNSEDIIHEAQLLAVFAEVIQKKGYEYWDDDTFADYAKTLSAAAHEIAVAAEEDNYQRAKGALGRATKACSECHEGYRG